MDLDLYYEGPLYTSQPSVYWLNRGYTKKFIPLIKNLWLAKARYELSFSQDDFHVFEIADMCLRLARREFNDYVDNRMSPIIDFLDAAEASANRMNNSFDRLLYRIQEKKRKRHWKKVIR